MAARGLYHQGFALQGGSPYTGYVAVRASRPAVLRVALEDWGDGPSAGVVGTANGTGTTVDSLAAAELRHVGNGEWAVLNFTLVPSRSTECKPYPFGKAPLDCSIPRSQEASPPAATGDCVVCGGTLAVWVDAADGGAAVAVDQVFLEPGEWGRFQGLHVHRAPVEWVLAMGTRMLRYGGTFTETVQGHWMDQRGPAYARPPCTAGKAAGGRGGCKLTKLARWTRGYGPIEAMQVCEAAGVACTVGFAASETVDDMANFVRYAYDPPRSGSKWAALRAADGHPEPYPPISVEISNEACMASFLGTFAPKIAAMEAAAKAAGVGGRLRYVTGTYLGLVSPDAKCPGSPNTTLQVLREVQQVGLCDQTRVDTHVTPGAGGEPSMPLFAAQLQSMADSVGCGGAKLVVLEQNKCSSHFDRALANGGAANGLQRIPTLVATATSQCWNAGAHADGCGEGHINVIPGTVWGAPPYYASKMAYTAYAPRALAVDVSPVTAAGGKNLTVFAGSSANGEAVVVRVVNGNNFSVAAALRFDGNATVPSGSTAAVQTLTSPLYGTPSFDALGGGWNSPSDPLFISPKQSSWTFRGEQPAYVLPPMSFVVMAWGPPLASAPTTRAADSAA